MISVKFDKFINSDLWKGSFIGSKENSWKISVNDMFGKKGLHRKS